MTPAEHRDALLKELAGWPAKVRLSIAHSVYRETAKRLGKCRRQCKADDCGKVFEALGRKHVYCSGKCADSERSKLYRARKTKRASNVVKLRAIGGGKS